MHGYLQESEAATVYVLEKFQWFSCEAMSAAIVNIVKLKRYDTFMSDTCQYSKTKNIWYIHEWY